MSATAIQRAMARQRRGNDPRPRPQLRLVHDADEAITPVQTPQALPKKHRGLKDPYAFALVVVVIVSAFWTGAGLGRFSDDLEIRMQVAEIQATTELPPPLKQIGTFNRERGG